MTRQRVTLPRPTMVALLPLLGLFACESVPVSPDLDIALAFSVTELDLGAARLGSVAVRNSGSRAVGPVELLPGPVRDEAGNVVPGSSVRVTPQSIATLNPGGSASIAVAVEVNGTVQAGTYGGEMTARVSGEPDVTLPLAFRIDAPPTTEIAELVITTSAVSVRQGDVLQLTAEGTLSGGGAATDLLIGWSAEPAGSAFIDGDGRLVGYEGGSVTVTAEYGGHSDSHTIVVSARGLSGSVTKTGEAVVTDRFTSDLWLHGAYAYTGTWGRRQNGGTASFGNRLYTWDVSDPASPVRTGQLTVEARTVNDVKVRADGQLALLTHEGSNDGLNGVTLLDLTDPSSPVEITRFTAGLSSGIHNAWIEGDYAFLVLDGTGNGMRVLDVSDPTSPTVVASYYAGQSFLHDIYVRDGLAFLSHWGAGLVILDVGNGVRGGSPTNPVEVSRLSDLGGETHNAWYWPAAGYVFVGEEDFSTPGIMRVVDVSDIEDPSVVATYSVPGTTPHNFWLDEASGVLYLAWYENGLRGLDVRGELLGELERQGREFFGQTYNGAGQGCTSGSGTCTWAPQVHDGRIFVSDMNNGVIVLTPTP